MASLSVFPLSFFCRLVVFFVFFFSKVNVFLLVCIILSSSPSSVLCHCKNPPVIFNFGDSNSDTGGLVAALGYPVNLPNGRSFFKKSTGRLSDGRLVIDFLFRMVIHQVVSSHGYTSGGVSFLIKDCSSVYAGQSVNTSFLRPYLDSLGTTFSNGVNFAVVGSSTLPKYVPFSLHIQAMQFLHFRDRSMELVTAGSMNLIGDEGFRNALYVIDIGQNDLADSFAKNLSYAQVVTTIPSIIVEIKNAVEDIYSQGGRNFWVHNTGPLGCLPQKLSLAQKSSSDLDSYGCLTSDNSAAVLFNEGLHHLCTELRSKMKDATIVYVDVYAIKYDLIANSSKYGFSSPLMACCGFGGPPYNYNIKVTCGQPGYQVCSEGSGYISWDGIHYSEAANRFIASKILSTDYSTPRLSFDYFCR